MTLITREVTNAGALLYSPNGAILPGVEIVFTLTDTRGRWVSAWDAVSNEFVGGQAVRVVTDATASFTVSLWPNSRGSEATQYQCEVRQPGFKPFYGNVPDTAGPLSWIQFSSGGTPLAPAQLDILNTYKAGFDAALAAAEQAAADAAASASGGGPGHPGNHDDLTQAILSNAESLIRTQTLIVNHIAFA